MKKTMILIAVLAVMASAMGAVGLANAQSISTTSMAGTAAATATDTGTQDITVGFSPEQIVASYMDAEQAKVLGMTTTDYQAQEDAGLAWLQIATAQGKTEAEAQTLLETAYSNAIAQALTNGKITQAMADSLKAVPASDLEMGGRGNGNADGNDAIEPYLEEAFAKALGMTLADFDTQEAAGKGWLEIAVAQGKTEAEAQTLFATAYGQSIDQALADGKITQTIADALKAATVPTISIGLSGKGRGGTTNGNDAVHTYLEEAFAKALGMTIADFDTQEAAGNSWLQIATAQGKTEAEAQTLLETAYSNAIAQALADGKITQTMADTLKADAAPTFANVGIPGHGQSGSADNGQPGGHGGRGHGGHDDSTGNTTTPTTNP
jgi:hypothetical protein